uniref:Uncharacterized protein n=1 Tax=Cacopsylla melanoneura TaxID=428564 RepID=A0A8D8LUK4_9HEMI
MNKFMLDLRTDFLNLIGKRFRFGATCDDLRISTLTSQYEYRPERKKIVSSFFRVRNGIGCVKGVLRVPQVQSLGPKKARGLEFDKFPQAQPRYYRDHQILPVLEQCEYIR